VRNKIRGVEGVGHKLFVDNLLSSLALFDDMNATKIKCCGSVHPNCKGIPCEFGCKTVQVIRVTHKAESGEICP
jgi:hypothetical protein